MGEKEIDVVWCGSCLNRQIFSPFYIRVFERGRKAKGVVAFWLSCALQEWPWFGFGEMAEMDRKTRRVSRRRSLFVDEKASAGEIMQVEDVDGFRFRKRTKKTVRLSFSQVEAAEKVPPEERGRETDAREKAPSVDRSAVNEQQPGNMEVHEGDFVALKQQAEKVEALTVAEHVTPDAEHMAEEVRQGAVKESVTEESHAEKNKNGDAQRTEQKNVEAKAANSESESPAADNAEAAPPSTTKRAPAIYQQTRPKERDNLNTSSLRPPSAGHSVFKRKPSQTENKRTSPSEICPELKETCSMLLQQGIESLMTYVPAVQLGTSTQAAA